MKNTKLVTINYTWFNEARTIEAEADKICTAIFDDFTNRGEIVSSVKIAYGSTVCVTFEDGCNYFIHLLIKSKRSSR